MRRKVELRGHIFLSREAPSLPLRKCDNPKCTCRYEHHENRRTGPRRFRELGVSIDGYLDEERRDETKRDRRKTIGDLLGGVPHQRALPMAAIADERIPRRSSPNVDIGPWPGTNRTSSPSGNSLSRIELTSVS